MTLHRGATLAIVVMCGVAVTGNAFAQPGQLDPSFGTGGKVTTSFSDRDYAIAVAIQPDGKIIAAGRSFSGTDPVTADFAVLRYNADGSLDGSFGTAGKVTTDFFGFRDVAGAIAVQNDGKIVVAGFATGSASPFDTRLALARYETNGNLDQGFGTGGKAMLRHVQFLEFGSPLCQFIPVPVVGAAGLAIQTDGKIIVGAIIRDGFYGDFLGIARYETTGLLDSTFHSARAGCGQPLGDEIFVEHVFHELTFGIALQNDGKIVVGGNENSDQRVVLARALSSGSLDTTFGTGGFASYAPPSFAATERGVAIASQPDGKIVVAGSMFRPNFGTSYRQAVEIKRYNANGTLDGAFGNGGTAELWTVNGGMTADALVLDTAGNIVVAGCVETGGVSFSFCGSEGTVADFLVARFTPQGALDQTFGTPWSKADFFGLRDDATGIALQADGRIVVAGGAFAGANQEDFALARVLGGTVTCDATLSPTAASVGRAGGSGAVTVSVSVGCAWAAQSNASWITVTGGATGSGNGTVTYSYATNSSTSPRTGTLTIAGKTFTLTQAQSSAPTITSHPASVAVLAGQGAYFSVGVTGDPWPTFQWQISSDGIAWANVPNAAPYSGVTSPTLWITTALSGLSGNRYRATATNSAGSATSNAATLTVNPPSCAYAVSVNEVVVSALGATGGVDLTTGATCTWTAASTESWLTITPTSGTGSARINYTVAAFSGTAQRTATLTVVNKSVLFRQNGASNPTSVQPPTDLIASSIAGNLVTLRWNPPASGPAPTSYSLEGGVSPSQVLASLSTSSPNPIFTFTAPSGAFYIRMHSISGPNRSVASNEIHIFVNTSASPSGPANLLGLVNGSSLTLAWRNTFAGGTPTSMMLDVSGSIVTSIPLGPTDSFTFAGVPAGTYTFAVRATNSWGTSVASNAVALTFPAVCSGAPLTPANFLAYKVGNTIFVVWDPPASGPAPSGYVLNVTGSFVGTFPVTSRALSGTVGPGAYGLSVIATNTCGSSTATTVQTVIIP